MKGMFPQRQGSSDGNCASTENLEAELESGNVDTGGSTTVTKSHSPSAIASDELSLAIEDMDIGHRATKRKRIQTLVLIQVGIIRCDCVIFTMNLCALYRYS